MNGDLHQPQPQPPLPPPRSVCEDCKSDDGLILHIVPRTPKSQPQKLCTSCVLQYYHKSFCSECFELYDANTLSAPPVSTAATTGNNRLLMCIRCDNWSHVNCPKANTPRSPYLCQLCSPGNLKYFDYRKPSNENGNVNKAIGKDEAKRLYAAARISVITMNKAASTVKLEADRRVKEAALAKKRAKEAIDHVFAVSAKVGVKWREVNASTALSAGPKIENGMAVRLDRNGGDLEAMNVVDKGNVNGNGAVVTVSVPVAVVMPPHQQNNINGGGGLKDSGNVGQPQSI